MATATVRATASAMGNGYGNGNGNGNGNRNDSERKHENQSVNVRCLIRGRWEQEVCRTLQTKVKSKIPKKKPNKKGRLCFGQSHVVVVLDACVVLALVVVAVGLLKLCVGCEQNLLRTSNYTFLSVLPPACLVSYAQAFIKGSSTSYLGSVCIHKLCQNSFWHFFFGRGFEICLFVHSRLLFCAGRSQCAFHCSVPCTAGSCDSFSLWLRSA